MARIDTLINFLTDVASAIKEKKGDDTPILASDFDTEIENLPSGSGGLDWSLIGYSEEPQFVQDGYNYAVEIKNNWIPSTNLSSKFNADKNLRIMPYVDTSIATDTSHMFDGCTELLSIPSLNMLNTTNISYMFYNCISLRYIPTFDFSKVTNGSYAFSNCNKLETIPQLNTLAITTMRSMFYSCTNLKNVPVLDTSKVNGSSGFQGTFTYCTSLTDTSLDNILQMCINATKYSSNKSLARLGISDTSIYPASRIQALPHYQDFIDAGWTI